MTEEEWLASEDPRAMTAEWPWPVSERKARLFACTCCRRIWPLLTEPESRRAVEVSEALADGRAREGQRSGAHDAARSVAFRLRRSAPWAAAEASGRLLRQYRKTASVMQWAGRAAYHSHEAAYTGAYEAAGTDDVAAFRAGSRAKESELRIQADLLRDVVGNPFRSITFDPTWRTTDVLLLARGIYKERAFDRMPILADSLEEAGCNNEDVLNHCRGPGPHVRGCHVVDLVLGME